MSDSRAGGLRAAENADAMRDTRFSRALMPPLYHATPIS